MLVLRNADSIHVGTRKPKSLKGLGVRGGIERQGLIMRITLYNVIEKHPVCLVLFDNAILSKNL